jgi:nucleoside-diphosphate-sugar epimerase
MRIFVTGATGFVGSAVIKELLGAGHRVLGLTRSASGAAALTAAGAEVHRGDLEDLDSLRRGAGSTDGVVHTAFIHDFSKFAENCEIDRRAIQALGAELAGSGRPLIVTSGTGLLSQGGDVTEDMAPPADSPIPRVSEQAGLALASEGVRAMAIRLPPSVHGEGDHGFVPALIGIAREKGISAYIGAGDNPWPSVHRFDAARLYRLVLEKGLAGARYHATAEEGIPFRAIAELIGHRLNLPVVSLSKEEVGPHFGWFSHFAAMGNRASSARTRAELGWQPREKGLVADIDNAYYFAG